MTKYLKKDGMGKPRICAQCRRGYDGNEDPTVGPAEAEYYVRGIVWDGSGERRAPYHGYLCEGHLDMMQTDGAEFKEITELTDMIPKISTKTETPSYTPTTPKKEKFTMLNRNETTEEWYERVSRKNRGETPLTLCGKNFPTSDLAEKAANIWFKEAPWEVGYIEGCGFVIRVPEKYMSENAKWHRISRQPDCMINSPC
jgi:hypothetical protein